MDETSPFPGYEPFAVVCGYDFVGTAYVEPTKEPTRWGFSLATAAYGPFMAKDKRTAILAARRFPYAVAESMRRMGAEMRREIADVLS